MKPIFFLLSLVLFSSNALAGSAKVFLQTHVESERGTKHDPKSPDESRARWLVVKVTNPTPVRMEGLSLKWTLYADDLKRGANDIVVEKSGSESFGVEASGNSATVTTPKVVFEWTPQHSVRTGSGRRSSSKRVDEAGHRYHGYTVQIIQNGEVIGQVASDPKLLKADR